MTRDRKTEHVNIRLQRRLREVAERAAADDSRTLGNLLEKVLVEHLKKHGYIDQHGRERAFARSGAV